MDQDTSLPSNGSIAPKPAAPKSYNKILLGLLALSMVGNVYLFVGKNKVSEQNNFLISENTDINAAKRHTTKPIRCRIG